MDKELEQAIKDGNLEKVQALISKSTINTLDDDGNSPLMLAILSERTEVASYLLQHPDIKINQFNSNTAETALQMAAKKGNLEIVMRLLLEKNVEPPKDLTSSHSGIAILIQDVTKYKQLEDILKNGLKKLPATDDSNNANKNFETRVGEMEFQFGKKYSQFTQGGLGVKPEDTKKQMSWFQKGASHGSAACMFELGFADLNVGPDRPIEENLFKGNIESGVSWLSKGILALNPEKGTNGIALQKLADIADLNYKDAKEEDEIFGIYEACKFLGEYYSGKFKETPKIESHELALKFLQRADEIYKIVLTPFQQDRKKEGKTLLQNFNNIINTRISYAFTSRKLNITPLSAALYNKDTPLAKYLLNQSNIDIHLRDDDNTKSSALDIAAYNHNYEIVLQLMMRKDATIFSTAHGKDNMLEFIKNLREYRTLNDAEKPETLAQRALLENKIFKTCFEQMTDKNIADEWLLKAAEHGNLESMLIVAAAYKKSTAPIIIATKIPILTETPYSIGSSCEVKDTANNWLAATILEKRSDQILIHYNGWGSKWDEWISLSSDRLAPLGTRTTYSVKSTCDVKDSVNNWLAATILEKKNDKFLIHYDGWNSKWDEWISLSSDRLAPLGTHTTNNATSSAAIPTTTTTATATATNILKNLEKSVNYYFKSYLSTTDEKIRSQIINDLTDIANLSILDNTSDTEKAGIYDANMKLGNIYLREAVKTPSMLNKALEHLEKAASHYPKLSSDQKMNRGADLIFLKLLSGQTNLLLEEEKQDKKTEIKMRLNANIPPLAEAMKKSEEAYLLTKLSLTHPGLTQFATTYFLKSSGLGDDELKKTYNNIMKDDSEIEKAFKKLYGPEPDFEEAALDFKTLAEKAKEDKQYSTAYEFYINSAVSRLSSERTPEETYVEYAILALDSALECGYLLSDKNQIKRDLTTLTNLIILFKHDENCFKSGVEALRHCYERAIKINNTELQEFVMKCLNDLASEVKDKPEMLLHVTNATITLAEIEKKQTDSEKFIRQYKGKKEAKEETSDLTKLTTLIDQYDKALKLQENTSSESNIDYRRQLTPLLKERAAFYESIKNPDAALADYQRLKEYKDSEGYLKSAQLTLLQKNKNTYQEALEQYRQAVDFSKSTNNTKLAQQIINDLKKKYSALPDRDHDKSMMRTILQESIRVVINHNPRLAVEMRADIIPFLSDIKLESEKQCLKLIDNKDNKIDVKDAMIKMLESAGEGSSSNRQLIREAFVEWVNIGDHSSQLTAMDFDRLMKVAMMDKSKAEPEALYVISMIEAKLKMIIAIADLGESKNESEFEMVDDTKPRKQLRHFYQFILRASEKDDHYSHYENKLITLLSDSLKIETDPHEQKSIIDELSSYSQSKSMANRLLAQQTLYDEVSVGKNKKKPENKILDLAKNKNIFAMDYLATHYKTSTAYKLALYADILIATAGIPLEDNDIAKKAAGEINTLSGKKNNLAIWIQHFHAFLQKNPDMMKKITADKNISINHLILVAMDNPQLIQLPGTFNVDIKKLKKEYAENALKALDLKTKPDAFIAAAAQNTDTIVAYLKPSQPDEKKSEVETATEEEKIGQSLYTPPPSYNPVNINPEGVRLLYPILQQGEEGITTPSAPALPSEERPLTPVLYQEIPPENTSHSEVEGQTNTVDSDESEMIQVSRRSVSVSQQGLFSVTRTSSATPTPEIESPTSQIASDESEPGSPNEEKEMKALEERLAKLNEPSREKQKQSSDVIAPHARKIIKQ